MSVSVATPPSFNVQKHVTDFGIDSHLNKKKRASGSSSGGKDAIVTPPPSRWTAECHPREPEVTAEVDGGFLAQWAFPNERARAKFVDAGFSRVTCFYFPKSKDDRIAFACRLLTILFLIDDQLEDMSFEDGEAYNNSLMPIMRGDKKPNPSIAAETMMWDLWEGMRTCDATLADAVLEPTFTFMRAQTDRARNSMRNLGAYLEYREGDVGKALLSALMRFSMGLELTEQELAACRPMERNCSKQISVVNDIYSFEKELLQSKKGHEEGSVLCNAVEILAQEMEVRVSSAKRVLWTMVREWSDKHDEMVVGAKANGCSAAVSAYLKGLEYQMSGNEAWSESTLRYVAGEILEEAAALETTV